MVFARVKLNSKNIRRILTSQRVLDDMRRRAENIANAAGGQEDYRVEAEVGPVRARAAVITDSDEAKRDEATNKSLTKAIDAGRI